MDIIEQTLNLGPFDGVVLIVALIVAFLVIPAFDSWLIKQKRS